MDTEAIKISGPFNVDEIKARSFSISSSTTDTNLSASHQTKELIDKASRKKYNVITEEVRKQIIKKLTKENANIKEVAEEFGLKLSTCKAIFQVYLKEGRIGKKATRDRKSKIVNTIIIATINPLDFSQSFSVPYVEVSEAKINSKNGGGENDQKLIQQALKKAQEQLKVVLSQNSETLINQAQIQKAQQQQQQNVLLQQMMMKTQLNASLIKIAQQNCLNQGNQNTLETPSASKSFKLTKAALAGNSQKINRGFSKISSNPGKTFQEEGLESIKKKIFFVNGNSVEQVVAKTSNSEQV